MTPKVPPARSSLPLFEIYRQGYYVLVSLDDILQTKDTSIATRLLRVMFNRYLVYPEEALSILGDHDYTPKDQDHES